MGTLTKASMARSMARAYKYRSHWPLDICVATELAGFDQVRVCVAMKLRGCFKRKGATWNHPRAHSVIHLASPAARQGGEHENQPVHHHQGEPWAFEPCAPHPPACQPRSLDARHSRPSFRHVPQFESQERLRLFLADVRDVVKLLRGALPGPMQADEDNALAWERDEALHARMLEQARNPVSTFGEDSDTASVASMPSPTSSAAAVQFRARSASAASRQDDAAFGRHLPAVAGDDVRF